MEILFDGEPTDRFSPLFLDWLVDAVHGTQYFRDFDPAPGDADLNLRMKLSVPSASWVYVASYYLSLTTLFIVPSYLRVHYTLEVGVESEGRDPEVFLVEDSYRIWGHMTTGSWGQKNPFERPVRKILARVHESLGE